MDHDIAARINSKPLSNISLLFSWIPNTQRKMEGTSRISTSNPINSFWNFVVSRHGFGLFATSPECDPISPDNTAAIEQPHQMEMLFDHDIVDRRLRNRSLNR
jgi:hypothetical protein